MMPAKNQEEDLRAKRLLSKATDWITALPSPDVIGDTTWREKPVDLETWLYDPAYMNLGIKLSEPQFNFLLAMDDIDPATNRYTEFVAEWGKGSGKDFISALGGLRQVYLLLCLRDPYEFFGMAKNTGIQLVNVAVTKDQAKFVYFKQVKGLLKGSRWFAKQRYEITRERLKFDHEIEFVSTAADGDSAEGQNIFYGVMDEAAAFKTSNQVRAMNKAEGEKVEGSADAIYRVLRTSSNSRFPRVGKIVIISYPRFRDDFIQTKRKENELAGTGYTSGPFATWEINPRVKREDFADDYARNQETAEAMYECKPPYAVDGYVKYPHRFIECVARGKAMGLVSPIDEHNQYDLEFKGLPGRYYAIHVDLAVSKDKCALALGRQGEPVRRSKCPCNAFNFKDVERCTTCGRPTAQWISTDLPTMVVSLLKAFKPGPKGEVDFSDVRDEIIWIRDRGHKIWALSYDGWQSVDSRQIMAGILGKKTIRDRWNPQKEREEDIVSLLSVDRNTEAHDTLKEFIYDERFFIYAPDGPIPGHVSLKEWLENDQNQDIIAQAFREWRALRLINGKKVDHPMGGSKDLVDALAGVAYHVARMPLVRNRMPTIAGWRETAH